MRAGEEYHRPEGGLALLVENIVAPFNCHKRGDEQFSVRVFGKGSKVAPAEGSSPAVRAIRLPLTGVIQVGVVCGEHFNPAPPAGHRFEEVGCRSGFAVAAHQEQCPAPGLVGNLAQLLVQEARLPGAGSA